MIEIILMFIFSIKISSEQQSITNIIVLPFKTYKEENSNPFNISSFVKNHIYTEINISDQTLVASFNSETYSFYMTNENCIENSNYIIQNSKSFTNISDFSSQKSGYASERMYLSRDIDLKIKQFGLYTRMHIKEYNNKRQCAVFGLRIKTEPYQYDDPSFIDTFKSNGNIKGYQWTLKYNSNDEGLLVLGDTPLEYDPSYKDKKNLEHKTNAIIMGNNFGLRFNSIIFNNEKLESPINAIFYYESNVILVNNHFFFNISNIFFKPYLDNYKCEIIPEPLKYIYIQCHGNNFTDNDIKSFPALYFKSVDMNYTFELNHEDLFSKEKDGQIYFKIVFDLKYSGMKFGKPFLKKYPFTIDNNKYTISLYVEEKPDQSSEEKERNYAVVIILSIISFCLLALVIYFGYKLFIKRGKEKKRANELDEDYDYISKQDNVINQSNKVSLTNNLGL